MGGGSYSSIVSYSDSGERKLTFDDSIRRSHHSSKGVDYMSMSSSEIFKQRAINNAMNPYGVKIRESRDSEEHPNSLAIMIALDLTGSMGSIPNFLVKDGLPDCMGRIIKGGILDPQILFIGVGDHECDQSPLQVGQFESDDELVDKWLTDVWLEGGGGSNYGESYLLAWYFAGFHTEIDCFEKRGQKGFLFTIGDEPCLKELPQSALKKIMGEGQYQSFSHFELLDKAKEKYNVFHIHVNSGRGEDEWKQLIGDNLIVVKNHKDVSKVIAEKILEVNQKQSSVTSRKVDSSKENVSQKPKNEEETNFIL